ncbi:hypothetical protein K437DRAFT_260209, partial [Tilletiaria anomala UBC 951]
MPRTSRLDAEGDNPHPDAGPIIGHTELKRHAHIAALLGKDTADKIAKARVLVIGAGGIGCELLKNLAMVGFGDIEIIDLDTIDLSNLNRQFLFQKQHIHKPKSLIARETALSFNPHVNITAHHDNIKAPKYGLRWFAGFDIVLNALDNLDARRWVNRMCVAANVPLVESGTTGFLGQVQPIFPGKTQCYDCTEKPIPKSYPVCTIRSTPSAPIHCIVWSKSWLFAQLFGPEDETEEQELQKALANGENAEEIEKLQEESKEIKSIRVSLVEGEGAAQRVFEKVFRKDVERLLGMENMWKNRIKPRALIWDEAKKWEHTELPPAAIAAETNATAAQPAKVPGLAPAATRNGSTQASGEGLKDHQALTLQQNVELFENSLLNLAKRATASPDDPLSFDKDDDDALDFVTASSNLRSFVYAIPRKTRFEVKEMAGNIIPAIASTNAIIAGQIVIQAIQALRGRWDQAHFVTLSRSGVRLLNGFEVAKPNPACSVCSENYGLLRVPSVEMVTLGEVLNKVVRKGRDAGGLGFDEASELSVYEGSRLLFDPDMDD